MNDNETWGQAFKAVFGAISRLFNGPTNAPAAPTAVPQAQNATSTEPKEDGFGILSNKITGTILMIMVFLIIAGSMLTLFGHGGKSLIIGLTMAGLGLTIMAKGYNSIPPDPPTYGVITKDGQVWLKDGKSIAVKGIFFLCNWPFIWISMIKIQATWEEMVFLVSILSKDKVPMTVEVRIMGRADRYEIQQFINNGTDHADRWKSIEQEIKGIVDNLAQIHTRDKDSTDIVQNSAGITQEIENVVCKIDQGNKTLRIGQKTFGVEIRRLQVSATLPEDIKKSRIDGAARQIEYDADVQAAVRLMEEARNKDETLTFMEALDRVNTLRRVRDKRDSRFDVVTSGPVKIGVMNFPGTNPNSGGDGRR